jgi:hypothetical protein
MRVIFLNSIIEKYLRLFHRQSLDKSIIIISTTVQSIIYSKITV